jgi:hypothetical protein
MCQCGRNNSNSPLSENIVNPHSDPSQETASSEPIRVFTDLAGSRSEAAGQPNRGIFIYLLIHLMVSLTNSIAKPKTSLKRNCFPARALLAMPYADLCESLDWSMNSFGAGAQAFERL